MRSFRLQPNSRPPLATCTDWTARMTETTHITEQFKRTIDKVAAAEIEVLSSDGDPTDNHHLAALAALCMDIAFYHDG